MVTVGVLSDTHLFKITDTFRQQAQQAFSECQVIIHAGDLTDDSILEAFRDKDCYSVCGNMCNMTTKRKLPAELLIEIEGYTIAVTHGNGGRHEIEHWLLDRYSQVDCIIFGHTHQPLCERIADVLLVNPGSFRTTSPYGAPATYALLTINGNGLQATIHQLSLHL